MCVSLMFIFFTVIRCSGHYKNFCFLSVILKDAFWCIIVAQWWSDSLACAQVWAPTQLIHKYPVLLRKQNKRKTLLPDTANMALRGNLGRC